MDNYGAENEFSITPVEIEETELTDDISETQTDDAPKADALPPKVEIVGVKFKKRGKTYHFSPNGVPFREGDKVIVDTSRGQEFGYITLSNREISSDKIVPPLRSVLRMATEAEEEIHDENVKKEIEAYNACIALIDRHKLEMKLIDAEISFDRSKLLFYFSSENRVDFRELVKDLASSFHTRIEMRQIGIRDEAKILGGLGICGRPFCCSTFLQDFAQVSVKMAKEQNLSLNAAKISGSCGRLMCCLRYEQDTYLAEKALTPKVDTRVVTPDGPGIVTDANPLAGIVKVQLDSAPADSSPSIFVREDVVKENEYNGEKLVKTPVPDRSHKNDREKEFMPVIPIEAPIIEAPAKPEPPKPVIKNENSINKNDRLDRNHKGSNKSDRQENENKPQQSFDKKKNNNNRQNTPKDDRRDGANQQNQTKNAPPNGVEQGRKKKYRPYYRNFRKNKGSGEKK